MTNEPFISLQEPVEGDEAVGEESAATHFSQLDPKNMKVAELRTELEARNLPSKGKKFKNFFKSRVQWK